MLHMIGGAYRLADFPQDKGCSYLKKRCIINCPCGYLCPALTSPSLPFPALFPYSLDQMYCSEDSNDAGGSRVRIECKMFTNNSALELGGAIVG